VQHTDVQEVHAEVLDVTNETDRQVVSVRFTGPVVEEKGAAPVDFREVWHLVKPHDDSRPGPSPASSPCSRSPVAAAPRRRYHCGMMRLQFGFPASPPSRRCSFWGPAHTPRARRRPPRRPLPRWHQLPAPWPRHRRPAHRRRAAACRPNCCRRQRYDQVAGHAFVDWHPVLREMLVAAPAARRQHDADLPLRTPGARWSR
jgi:hypothetical protein